MRLSMQQTIVEARANRPAATNNVYIPKQEEFKAWCRKKNFEGPFPELVTEDKLHLFLKEEVENRKRFTGNRSATIGYSSIALYVNSIVDLWSYQKSMNCNTAPNPRGSSVTALLKIWKSKEHQRKIQNFDDRGQGTVQDGYTSLQEIRRLAKDMWEKNSYRSLCAHFMCHAGLMRGDNIRGADLSDLFTLDMDNDLQDTSCVMLTLRRGKTNQFCRKEYACMIRSRDPLVCPVGALGFYLFIRFHVDQEPFPDLADKRSWYNMKILRHYRDSTKEISAHLHRSSIREHLKNAGISSKHSTHTSRAGGAVFAELQGASEDAIRRLGRWNPSSMESCYLSNIPISAVKSMAQFRPEEDIFLKRATLDPPASLQQQVFPCLENFLTENGTPQSTDVGTCGFVRILLYLRKVILQDAVVMRRLFPNSRVWSDPIFFSEGFHDFSQTLSASMDEAQRPAELTLRQAVPELRTYLDAHFTAIRAEHDALRNVSGKVEAFFGDLSSGRATFSISAPSVSSGIASPRGDAPPPANLLPNPMLRNQAESFTLSRGVKTVPDLWKLWESGINGSISVKDAKRRFGTEWPVGEKEKRFYRKRRRVIDLVNRVSVEMGLSDGDAVDRVETFRQEEDKTLNWLATDFDVAFDRITGLDQ